MVTMILLSLTALTAHIMSDLQVLTYNLSFFLFCTTFLSFFSSKITHFVLITFELHLHCHATLTPYMQCCCLPSSPTPVLTPPWTGCHSPSADPSLSLPPVSFNTLTQAQTWDSFSYSIPSEGDSDNGRCSIHHLLDFMLSENSVCGKCPMWLRMKANTVKQMFITPNASGDAC